MNLYTDTETCPPIPGSPAFLWMAQKSLAKGETPEQAEKAHRAAALSPVLGELAVFSLAIDQSEPFTLVRDFDDPEGERALVARVCREFRDMDKEMQFARNLQHLVAFNAPFDRGVIRTRAMKYGEKLPVSIHALGLKDWDRQNPWFCAMDALKASFGDRVSLDAACVAFDIPLPKGDIDGSKVWDYILQGLIAKVAAYCADDVRRVRAVYRAIMGVTERGVR